MAMHGLVHIVVGNNRKMMKAIFEIWIGYEVKISFDNKTLFITLTTVSTLIVFGIYYPIRKNITTQCNNCVQMNLVSIFER